MPKTGKPNVGQHVLVVENDHMSRELCRRVLTAGRYQVTMVDSGEEALQVAPDLQPDLILMDLGLPGIDGIQTTERLRLMRDTADIPVAVLSAQAYVGDMERAKQAGCVDYLTKPMGARELLQRVEQLLADAAERSA